MSLPTTLGSYRAHINALDKAEQNAAGVKLIFPDLPKAIRFRQMCYQARKIYHSNTGDCTKWEGLVITMNKPEASLTIEHQSCAYLEMIPLSGVDEPSETLAMLDQGDAISAHAREMRQPEVMYPQSNQYGFAPQVSRRNTPPRQLDPDIIVELPADFNPNAEFKLGDLE